METAKKPNHLLRYEREKRGWSQRKLAELLDTGEEVVSRWERGERKTSPFYQEHLCRIFGKDAVELGFLDQPSHEEHFLEDRMENVRDKAANLLDNIDTLNLQPHHLLSKYLQEERARILNALAPGSTNLWVRDIVGENGLFIPPPWEMLQGEARSANLVEYLIDALAEGQSTLLLGDAGQGKTTILKQIFRLMVDRFLSEAGSTSPFPLYIPLREFSSLEGNATEILWTYVCDEFPLPFKDFAFLVRNNRIVLLLDGFDEIKGHLTQQSLNERAASEIFARPSILSCRKSFFEFYLSMSLLQEYYPRWIELQPLTMTQSVTRYITTFYQRKQNKMTSSTGITPGKIIETIKSNQELQDLASRPLLLV